MPVLLWAEFSIQFLIPAIFLVIWALNQVFGRAEAPPVAGRDRIGPRPMPTGPSRAPQASRGATGPRTASPKPPTGREPARAQGKGGGPGRDRGTSPQARPAEPPRTSGPRPAIVDEVYAIYEEDRASPKSVAAPPLAPISAAALRPVPSSMPSGPVGSQVLTDVLGRGFDPERLREAFLLSVVLAPPVAARRGRHAAPPALAPEGQPGEE